ncbi:MAG: coenzyme F420-0:L-glutamate ligase [Chloroflexi bacterium]|nr:coenzyme F420-0:L-glutamate ligase [Chloroflexota bacterium]
MQQQTGAAVGVIITDSHGRPVSFRHSGRGYWCSWPGGPCGTGAAKRIGTGIFLQYTDVGVADEIAAATGLVMGQGSEGRPVVLVRGLELPPQTGRASDLIRPAALDLYR